MLGITAGGYRDGGAGHSVADSGGTRKGRTVRCAPCCEFLIALSADHCMQFQTIGTPGVGFVFSIASITTDTDTNWPGAGM
ncbi:unannotated protein [freshwater metagenome]|uniref:Unannotated protein n=1 Tax=freshwater metagenome TaxID=449393 RepID=A0A6J6SDG2_9ZZZZ